MNFISGKHIIRNIILAYHFGYQTAFRTYLKMEFKELIKKDAEVALGQELEHLKTTLPIALQIAAEEYKKVRNEFTGFQRLFNKFLSSDGQLGINWDCIEKLPSDSVSSCMKIYNKILAIVQILSV